MDRICINLVSAFQVLDAVTRRSLEESGTKIECNITSGNQPFYKGDGCYLFLQPPDPEAVLTIRAYGYRTFRGTPADFTASKGIHRIYIQPDDQYPLSKEIYGIQGMAEPETTLFLICRESAARSWLTEDYEAGAETILLSVKDREDHQGKDFRIQEGEQTEFIELMEPGKATQEQYSLAAPLSYSYHKGIAAVVPAKRIPVDVSGEFVCYWMRSKDRRAACICELWKENGTEWKKLELQAGVRLSVGRMV